MTEEEKRLNAQKYFVFKLVEYFRNTYGVLQNKRYDSLSAMAEEILDILNVINRSKIDATHLLRGLDGLLEGFKYQWSNHPLIKHNLLKRDINHLISKIKLDRENDSDYLIALYNSIRSMVKKLEKKSIVRIYIDVLENESLTYGEIDKMLDSFVSELLFQGYSLKYLEEWYSKEIHPLIMDSDLTREKILNALEEIGSLACSRKKFHVVFMCRLPKELLRELEEQREIKIRSLIIIDGTSIVNEIEKSAKIHERSKYLYTEVLSCDKYKAIEIIKNSIESYTEIYKTLTNTSKATINDKTLFFISADETNWDRIVLEDAMDVGSKITSINKQEKEDIEDLIILRRTLNSGEEENHDISIIERTFEITKNALEISSTNRLLNVWSGLEYISTYYYKDKIIERIRCIVPRVICLYCLKNKMNILWDRMKYHRYKGDLEFVNYCVDSVAKEGNRLEYDTMKLAGFLLDIDKAGKLCSQFSRNIIIQREISELNGLLSNKEGFALNSIVDLNELIKQDLNRIYRVRNKLVHSGSKAPENIEIFTYRLYKYLNSLLSTLIYHIRKNQNTTITEILYSIVESYEWYIAMISAISKDNLQDNLMDLISPEYLYQ